MLSFILLTACKVEKPENTTVSASVQTEAPKTQSPSPEVTTKGVANNLNITEQSIEIRLPNPKVEQGVSKYCYFQEMPTLEVGMTGLKFDANEGVRFIRMQGVQADTANVKTNQWMKCSELGEGVSTIPIYEVVGVDLSQSEGTLFKGFNWFSLPESTAFAFPGAELWMFEVDLNDGVSENVSITATVSTTPKESIKEWAGVFEMTMEKKAEGKYEAQCTLPQDLNLLSAFGHSEPSVGSWSVTCGEEEIFGVDAKQFASDVPPLKSFEQPKGVPSGTICSLSCDWGEDNGSICVASLVATSLEGPMTCVDGTIKPN